MSIIFEHTQKNYEEDGIVSIGKSDSKICRFCRKSGKTFEKRAHSIPEFLGNKTVFTLDECDDCNTFFGQKIEPELKKFIGPSVFHNLKGKKGWPISEVKGNIKINSTDQHRLIEIKSSENFKPEKYEFTIKGKKFSCLKVYKGLVKILLSIMPSEYLSEFDTTSEWLMTGRDFEKICHVPWVLFGQQPPDFRHANLMDICLIRNQSEKGVVYQMTANFNSIKIILPFSPISKAKFRIGEVFDEGTEYKRYLFEWIDFSKSYTRKDFNFSVDLSSIK